MGIDESSEGGRAFIQSLYDLYASWGVDFGMSTLIMLMQLLFFLHRWYKRQVLVMNCVCFDYSET